jgi:hypothetical protein
VHCFLTPGIFSRLSSILAAFTINIFVVAGQGASVEFAAPAIAALVIIGLIALANVIVRYSLPFGGVAIWALSGIVVKHSNVEAIRTTGTAMAIIVGVACLAMLAWRGYVNLKEPVSRLLHRGK